MKRYTLACFVILALGTHCAPISYQAIGKKVRQNEGKLKPLNWMQGEEWLSCGIGHFIWYPAKRDRYAEMFPSFIAYAQRRGVQLPQWLTPQLVCPWATREEFLEAEKNDPRVAELREFLENSFDTQASFLVERLAPVLKNIIARAKNNSVRDLIAQLQRTQQGLYILVDYLNFKGDGLNLNERYTDEGWGLLQVLEYAAQRADISKKAENRFADAAEVLLKRRVRNAPASRNEARWLQGWLNRVQTYRFS